MDSFIFKNFYRKYVILEKSIKFVKGNVGNYYFKISNIQKILHTSFLNSLNNLFKYVITFHF